MTQQIDERVAFLRQLPFFRNMLLKELTAIGVQCRMKSYVQDALILSEGTPGKGLYIIRKGIVRVVKRGPNGVEKLVDRLKEFNFFGEMSLLDRSPASASVLAAEDCEFLVLEPEPFDELLAKDPVVGTQLLLVIGRVLVQRLRRGDVHSVYGAVKDD